MRQETDDGTRMVAPRGANANGMKLDGASWVFVEGKEVVGAEDGGGRFQYGTYRMWMNQRILM